MKRIIFTGALALLLLSGCGQEQRQLEYIGADSAKKLALEAAGVSAADAEQTRTDMGTRNGMDYYSVEFTCGGDTYQFDIDALTGVVIDSRTPDVTPAEAAQPEDGAQPGDGLVTDADTFIQASDVPDAQTPLCALPSAAAAQGEGRETAIITAEEAKAAALAHAGLTADQVTLVKSKLDWEDGRQVYEIEFYTPDYKEYDYEIDSNTGQVLKYDYEAEHFTPPNGTESSAISAERAKQLALAQVPGAAESDIWEFETDYDDGRLEYEGKIIYKEMEYEFKIDGYSGAIREWEAESIYD